MSEFHDLEASDGIRLSWNVFPSSRLEATRIVAPIGALYTPMKPIEGLLCLPYEPVYCRAPCRAILNPHCRIDFVGKVWTCPFCFQRNHFPQHYARDITETNLPGELIPNFTTIEYQIGRTRATPPVFLFVVDTCMIEEELAHLKDSLILSLNLMPEDCLIGLITFGTVVQVHEICDSEYPKSYVFRGTSPVTPQQIAELLCLGPKRKQPANPNAAQQNSKLPDVDNSSRTSRFIQPVSVCMEAISQILEDIQCDPWPVQGDRRATRCTGTAMSVASSILEVCFANQGCRMMLFVSGPCTEGEGKQVSLDLSEQMRSHADLSKGQQAPHYERARAYYAALAQRLVKNGHVCDVFACSLDQVGLLEMMPCLQQTGGRVVLHDSFEGDVFKQSYMGFFRRDEDQGDLQMGFAATLEIQASAEFKVCGAIGPCSSLGKMSPSVSEVEIGAGKTCAWAMPSIDYNTTLAFYFEVVNNHNTPIPQGKMFQLQILTRYQHPRGENRLRVTTLQFPWADTTNAVNIARGFDQDACAVLTARLAVEKSLKEETFDIMRWLDRMLIRLVSKFAQYVKDDPNSFQLAANFSIFPQFMFHLRRSAFLQVFGYSPDESAWFRYLLCRETTTNGLIMIQPTLLAYQLASPPMAVLLDNASVASDRILLLDTFFHILIFHGETIAQWRKQGYHEQPGYENVKELLEAPKEDAVLLMRDRFPVPRYTECDQHGSQARVLLAKLNPSTSSNQSGFQGAAGENPIYTDDVSFGVFMEHLKKLAVQGQ